MQKSVILFLFIVAVFISVKNDQTLPPNPRTVAPAVYLYSALALSADFLGGLPVVLAAMLTVALYWRSQDQKKKTKKKTVKQPAGPIGPIGG